MRGKTGDSTNRMIYYMKCNYIQIEV